MATYHATSDIIATHLYRSLFVRPLVRPYFMRDRSITFVIWDVLQLTESACVDASDTSQTAMRSPARTCEPSAPFVRSEPLSMIGRSFFPLSTQSIYISTPDAWLSICLPFLSALPSSFPLSRKAQLALCAAVLLKCKDL